MMSKPATAGLRLRPASGLPDLDRGGARTLSALRVARRGKTSTPRRVVELPVRHAVAEAAARQARSCRVCREEFDVEESCSSRSTIRTATALPGEGTGLGTNHDQRYRTL